MTDGFLYPDKPKRGDKIAVLSPAGRSAARFPVPYELGLRRLREEFRLEPVEFPMTRAPEASPAERARDVEAAFADPDIRAIIATIGGEDEIKILKHLHPEVLAANPKPFFGYSDNANLHVFLWNLGIVSYNGGAVMVQFGRPGRMNPLTSESLRQAMFERGEFELRPAPEVGDEDRDWADAAAFDDEPRMEPATGWTWHGRNDKAAMGPGWGGCLEIIDWQLRTGRHIQDNAAYRDAILFLETSEEMPDATYVYRVLLGMGERGLLQEFAGVLWARPKAWSFEHRNGATQKQRYMDEQRAAVLKAMAEYNPSIPVVFGIEFGHGDPQYVLPSGGQIQIDPLAKSVRVEY